MKNHLPISVCECELTSRFQCVSEWELISWFECVCVWVRENSPPHLCLWVRERPHLPSTLPSNHTSANLLVNRILDGRTDRHTRFSAETLNPKPGHTQEDTHYTEWYPDIEGNPLHWVIPITDTPKRIPITLSDTLTLRETHYIEWYPLRTHPRGYPLHWVIPITLSDTDTLSSQNPPKSSPITLRTLFSSQTDQTLNDTHDIEGYLWHWVIPNTLAGKGLLFGRERIT